MINPESLPARLAPTPAAVVMLGMSYAASKAGVPISLVGGGIAIAALLAVTEPLKCLIATYSGRRKS
ncbi:hypothetical protein SAMN05660874_05605 [Saccharopolyspora flava]|uniref:Uncharacterized protein n=1 Tax=Saccharopolyspora flava TaxID=95161 RepID=A0A1I6V5K7_9PSEU|nr:hypothetical protein SAMN05660874_05605 [Saccharopolyspora flava]